MKNFGVRNYLKVKSLLTNEKGAQSLEWLGIAALLVMIIGVIGTFMDGTGTAAIKGVLSNIINEIKGQIGGGS